MEYLYGEGGIVHCVGWAYFILVWDEQGNGSVEDWWVKENYMIRMRKDLL